MLEMIRGFWECYKRGPVDERKVHKTHNDNPVLVWRWFHWAKRPHLYILYFESRMLEMRYKEIWK